MLPEMASATVGITGRLAQVPSGGPRPFAPACRLFSLRLVVAASRAIAGTGLLGVLGVTLGDIVRKPGLLGPTVLPGLAGLAPLDHPASSPPTARIERGAGRPFHVGALQ